MNADLDTWLERTWKIAKLAVLAAAVWGCMGITMRLEIWLDRGAEAEAAIRDAALATQQQAAVLESRAAIAMDAIQADADTLAKHGLVRW